MKILKYYIILMLLSSTLFAQSGKIPVFETGNIKTPPGANYEFIISKAKQETDAYFGGWRSEWIIDTVFFEGETREEADGDMVTIINPAFCVHSWAKQDIRKPVIMCYVGYSGVDQRGDPARWGFEEWICRDCLRWVRAKENRILIEPPKSEFELLKERVIESIKRRK